MHESTPSASRSLSPTPRASTAHVEDPLVRELFPESPTRFPRVAKVARTAAQMFCFNLCLFVRMLLLIIRYFDTFVQLLAALAPLAILASRWLPPRPARFLRYFAACLTAYVAVESTDIPIPLSALHAEAHELEIGLSWDTPIRLGGTAYMFNGENDNATLCRVVRACDGSCLDSGATNNLFPETAEGNLSKKGSGMSATQTSKHTERGTASATIETQFQLKVHLHHD